MSIYTWIVSDKSGPPLTCHTRGLSQNRPMMVGNVLVGKEVHGSAVGPSCKNDHIVVRNESVGNAFFRVHWMSFWAKTDHPVVGNELVGNGFQGPLEELLD